MKQCKFEYAPSKATFLQNGYTCPVLLLDHLLLAIIDAVSRVTTALTAEFFLFSVSHTYM